jgi:hypothetical protein
MRSQRKNDDGCFIVLASYEASPLLIGATGVRVIVAPRRDRGSVPHQSHHTTIPTVIEFSPKEFCNLLWWLLKGVLAL